MNIGVVRSWIPLCWVWRPGFSAACWASAAGFSSVPALVFVVGLTQHQAQGTTLALMVPPIGLLAAWTYYKHGNVDLKIAGLICLGFFLGGLFGAKLATVRLDPSCSSDSSASSC